MLVPSSIKEARENKGLSINFVASKLKLKPSIIKNLEEGLSLNGVHSFYESSYKRSIYKFLDIPIKPTEKKIHLMNYDFQVLMIIYSVVFFSFSLMTISYYLISNFSDNRTSQMFVDYYEDDNLMNLLKVSAKKTDIKFISHEEFIKNFKFIQSENSKNHILIKIKPNLKTYYKVHYLIDDLESFGQLNVNFDLIIKSEKDVLIDISDISAIDFIIFNNNKYKFLNDYRYYLKNFDIKKLYDLK